MSLEGNFHAPGDIIDHTPAADVTGGQVLQLASGLAAVAERDIDYDISETGSVRIAGVCRIRNAAVAANLGDPVWWDEDGTAVDGSTGACTPRGSDGDFFIGHLVKALSATDTYALVNLNVQNPWFPAFINHTYVRKTADYTVLGTDAGKVVLVDGSAEGDDTIVITMTAISTLGDGFEVIIMNDAADGASQIDIDPNAGDKFLNPTALDDGDIYENTLATANRGDYVRIQSSAAGWYVLEQRGTWADGG